VHLTTTDLKRCRRRDAREEAIGQFGGGVGSLQDLVGQRLRRGNVDVGRVARHARDEVIAGGVHRFGLVRPLDAPAEFRAAAPLQDGLCFGAVDSDERVDREAVTVQVDPQGCLLELRLVPAVGIRDRNLHGGQAVQRRAERWRSDNRWLELVTCIILEDGVPALWLNAVGADPVVGGAGLERGRECLRVVRVGLDAIRRRWCRVRSASSV